MSCFGGTYYVNVPTLNMPKRGLTFYNIDNLLGRCHDMVDNLTVGMLEFGTLTIGTL
jgi:hypothetical protein